MKGGKAPSHTFLFVYAFSDTNLKRSKKIVCITPNRLDNGVIVACRSCWQCRSNRVNDYVGRCIAEQQHSDGVLAVNLTYAGGDDNPRSATLVYADFQKLIKKLRKAKYNVRYIVAGEYGTKRGRAHWHTVMFFNGKVPQVELDTEQYTWKYWEHGFAFFQQPDYEGFAYCLKYALKDQSQTVNTGNLSMSKKPPLGTAYFQDVARQYVDQGLAPQDPYYSFPDVFDSKRKRRKFMLSNCVLDNFIGHYQMLWEAEYQKPHPYSEMIEEYEDRQVDDTLSLGDIIERLKNKAKYEHYYERPVLRYVVCPNDILLIIYEDGSKELLYEKDGIECVKQIKTTVELRKANDGKLV